MKKTFLLCFIMGFILSVTAVAGPSFDFPKPSDKGPVPQGTTLNFIQNNGQLADFSGALRNEFLYYIKTEKLDIYFRKEGITYIFKKGPDIPSNSSLTKDEQEKAMRTFLDQKTLYYRLDVDFSGMNTNAALHGSGTDSFYYNFYQAHCPQGVMNVPAFEKVTYENVYDGIDFTFFLLNGKFKYDIILKPGADLNNIRLRFNGAKNLQLANNAVQIESPVGPIVESLPKSFMLDGAGKETETLVNYVLNGNEVRFQSDYNPENLLIIDPQISWTTYYDDCFWNGLGSDIDVKGTQCLITSYGFSNDFPPLDPGSSAYYQNATAGSGDFRILKFDTDGVRIWATYYGGTGYDHSPRVKLDYSGNIIVAGHTESTNIPTQTAGGYFDNTYNAGTFGGGTFIIKFNTTGVRQWASYYDYVSYPMVDVDLNNNIYVLGRSDYDDPPVLALAGAYNQALVSHDAGGTSSSMDLFIIKFNAATARTWATNLGSTCDEYPQDMHIGSDNFLNILAGGDNYYGTGIITFNPAGGAHYDNTLGIGGPGGGASDRDDALIYRINTAGALIWGTAFSGTLNENVQQGRITTDNSNNVFIYAETKSTNLPFTNPGGGAYFDNSFAAGGSGFNPFIAKFNSVGVLTWCTYFGSYGLGYGMNFSNFIGVNNSGNLILVTTEGGGVPGTFPLVPRAGDYNATLSVYMGVYIAEFASNLSVAWSTYFAGATDRHTLGDAVLASNSCGYELYMTSNWEKYDAAATDPTWVQPTASSYQNTTFFTTGNRSGLISRFSNLPSVAPVSITASPASLCAGTPSLLTLNGGSLGTGATWQWYSGSCGGTPAGTGTSITVNPSADSIYFVRAEGICNTTICASVALTVSGTSSAPASVSATTNPICSGNSTTLSVNGGTLGAGATWQWYAGSCNGTPIGNGTSILVSPAAPTTYFVRAEGSCDTTTCVSLAIAVNTVSTAPASVNATLNPLCTGDSTTLSVVGGSLGTAATWQWYSGSCGSTAIGTGSSISVSPAGNTSYFVLASGTCNTTLCASVNITANAPADATILSTSPVCLSEPAYNLLATDSNGTWSGTGITNTATGLFDPATAGLGNHEIIYTISGICGDTDTLSLMVVSAMDATISPAGPFCMNSSATILNAVTTGGTWSGSGITNTSTGAFNPNAAGIGTHSIIYTITGSCGNADTISVTINQPPSASVASVAESCVGANNGTATTTASGGTAPYSYLWENAATSSNISALAPGQYTVIITDANGCADKDTAYISAGTIACETIIPAVYIPNAFSPNGDGNNDVLFVRGQGISILELRIYDRWGEKVFETTELSNGWDGTFKGKMMDQGVFVYTMYVQFTDGTVKDDKGNISLIK